MEKTNPRPKCRGFIASSLDGFIAGPDDSLSWLDSFSQEGHDEDCGFGEFFGSIDALFLGRRTYEIVNGFEKWPYGGKRVFVWSSTLAKVRPEAELYNGPLERAPSYLAEQGVSHCWIDGGRTLSAFLEAGLLDALTVSLMPILLGRGIPLFSAFSKEIPLRLQSTVSYPMGVVQVRYRCAS